MLDVIRPLLPTTIRLSIAEYRTIYRLARYSAPYQPFVPSFARMLLLPRRRVLCHPKSVYSALLLGKLMAVSGYRPVFTADHRHDFSIHLPARSGQPVFNERHIGNGKARVAEAWRQACGYSPAVDPTTFAGPMVEKSEANATHDGRVVHGPLSAAAVHPARVYQRLLDNTDGDEVIDIRVPFYRGKIPLVYLKRRPLRDRFSNTNTSVSIADPATMFSPEELNAIERFAWLAGLDYGEADVLRNKDDGLIYVVDSTNGPAGPPNGLSPEDARHAVQTLAAVFQAAVESALSGKEWQPVASTAAAPHSNEAVSPS